MANDVMDIKDSVAGVRAWRRRLGIGSAAGNRCREYPSKFALSDQKIQHRVIGSRAEFDRNACGPIIGVDIIPVAYDGR